MTAVEALANAGHVLLGVDARDRDEAGLVTEVPTIAYAPNGGEGVEAARNAAKAALARAEENTDWVQPSLLLTWR